MLKSLDLDGVVLELISHDGWDRLLSIEWPTYKELTLDVLSTVEVAKYCPFTRQPSSISFCVFGKKHWVTQDQLGVLLGLYMEGYTLTDRFKDLAQDFPYQVTSEKYWASIATNSRTRKMSQMSNTAHHFIHTLLT